MVEDPRKGVAAVVVNWNTRVLLRDGLDNLAEHLLLGSTASPFGADEVCVVDNGSADDSVEGLEHAWPWVQVIRNSDNRGFCRASNQGIRATSAPYVLLINTDARLTDGCVEAMSKHLDDHPDVAIVGPRLEYGDGSFQRWTAGRPLSVWTCATYFLLLEHLGRWVPGVGSMYIRADVREPIDVGWVSSAVMLVRRSALDRTGLLDEQIFLYMDDVDLCDRARSQGYRVVYAGETTAVHFMGSSSERNTDGKASPEAIRSLFRWFRRRHGALPAVVLQVVVGVGFALRSAIYAVRSVVRPAGGSAKRKSIAHLSNLQTVLKGFS